jgi:CBS-domain-containing membrane protein
MMDPKDSKKTCWRPRIAQEGLLEAKISQRSRFGAILWSILGACFCTFSVPKSVPNSGPFFDLFLAPFWSEKVAKIDPESLQHGTGRPEKAPR